VSREDPYQELLEKKTASSRPFIMHDVESASRIAQPSLNVIFELLHFVRGKVLDHSLDFIISWVLTEASIRSPLVLGS
jgi:hypothetical protein